MFLYSLFVVNVFVCLGLYPGAELLSYWEGVWLTLQEANKQFSKVVVPFYAAIRDVCESCLLHILAND